MLPFASRAYVVHVAFVSHGRVVNWIELARLFCYHLATLMTLPDNGQDHVVDVAESESGPKADSSCHCSTCSLSFMSMQMQLS